MRWISTVRRSSGRLGVALLTSSLGTLTVGCGLAWASTWTTALAPGSNGAGQSQGTPSAPTGVTASCPSPTSSKTIKVAWTAVSHASSYAIYQSTTSSSSGFSVVASGIVTTSWTSGTLTAGNHYWYEAVASIGTNWKSPNSTATAQTTINYTSPYCTQP